MAPAPAGHLALALGKQTLTSLKATCSAVLNPTIGDLSLTICSRRFNSTDWPEQVEQLCVCYKTGLPNRFKSMNSGSEEEELKNK